MNSNRQCSSCGGFCKPSGCERENVSLVFDANEYKEHIFNLQGENNLLVDLLRDAYEVIKTIEGEDSDECDKLSDLKMGIDYALAFYDAKMVSKR